MRAPTRREERRDQAGQTCRVDAARSTRRSILEAGRFSLLPGSGGRRMCGLRRRSCNCERFPATGDPVGEWHRIIGESVSIRVSTSGVSHRIADAQHPPSPDSLILEMAVVPGQKLVSHTTARPVQTPAWRIGARVAAELGRGRHPVNDDVARRGEALLEADTSQVDRLEAVGVDETLLWRQGRWRAKV